VVVTVSFKDRRAQPNEVPNVAGEPVIKRVLHALLSKPEKPTYCEIQLTDKAGFVLRTLTPQAREWSEKFLAEPLPNGDRLVSGAIVATIAAEAIKRGCLVRFV
jgi:hypothetical protein